MRKIVCLILVFSLVAALPLPARGATKDDIAPYAQALIQYYRHHGEAAADVIWDILQQMAAVDTDQAAVWERLMDNWSRVNTTLPVVEGSLPAGLPEDGSLCIVVLGYGLNEDGSMKEELIDRLVVALTCALQYPNAPIVVTGGQTGEAQGITEAGQMASWLRKKGIDESRILQETQSYSTTANAVNTYQLLQKSCPHVTSIALVTSDYHLTWGAAMFTAVSDYRFGYEGGSPLELAAAAVCDTGKTADTMLQQAWGISTITGIVFDETAPAPALYPVDRPPEPTEETAVPAAPHSRQQSPAAQPQQAQEETPQEKKELSPILIIAISAAAAWLLLPKKPRKKRKKPEWNWDV